MVETQQDVFDAEWQKSPERMWPLLMNGERGQIAFKRIVRGVEHPLGQSVFSRVEQRQELTMPAREFVNQQRAQDESRSLGGGEIQIEMNRVAFIENDRDRRRRDLSAVEANRERFFRQRFEASARCVELRLGDSPVTISIHWRDQCYLVAGECQPHG